MFTLVGFKMIHNIAIYLPVKKQEKHVTEILKYTSTQPLNLHFNSPS